MQKINLEEIIKLYSLNDTITTRQSFIYFGKQLLELAAENASYIHEFDGAHGCECKVDRQSILDTIKQVE